MLEHNAYARLDWEYTSRNPWLAPVQDPRSSQYDDGFSYSLPATSYTSIRSGIKIHGWDISAFCDNLFNKFPTINYAQTQIDPFNPAGPPRPQEHDFTWRPRTFGITAAFRM